VISLLTYDEPIIPGESLSAFLIGDHITSYEEIFTAAASYDVDEIPWKKVVGLWQVDYMLGEVTEIGDEELHDLALASASAEERIEAGLPPPDLPAFEDPDSTPIVVVSVDLRDGTIFGLRARERYRGTLPGGIRVGMTIQEAMAVEPRVYFEDFSPARVRGIPGVALHVELEDPLPEQVPSMRIEEIGVFDSKRTDDGWLSY
jgi:hypothetical protein